MTLGKGCAAVQDFAKGEMPVRMKSSFFCVVLLLTAAAASASPSAGQRGAVQPLLLDLPTLAGAVPFTLQADVLIGDKAVVRETIEVERPQSGAAIRLMENNRVALAGLRKLEELHPGKLRISVSRNGQRIVDSGFAEADERSAQLVDASVAVIGVSRHADVSMTIKPRLRTQVSGECEDLCGDDYLFCLEWCDQRSGCQYCWEQYVSCLSSC